VLADGGVEFEDVNWGLSNIQDQAMKERFFEDCRKLGGHTTTNIPMLEMDGKIYTQSSAIIRHVGRITGAYSGCYEEDQLLATVEDLRSANYKAMRVFGATEKAIDEYIEVILPKHLNNFNRLLNQSSAFYLTGSKCSIADLSLYDALHVVERQVPGTLDKFPRVKLFFDTVGARPKIKEWVDSEQRKKLWAFPSIVEEMKGKRGGGTSTHWIAISGVVALTMFMFARKR
jgi:glutathione S-transferase